MVSNDGKRQNCKEDIAYLVVDGRTKSANGWEMSLGYICNHVKPVEGDEVDENGIQKVREEDQQQGVAEKKQFPVLVGIVGRVEQDLVETCRIQREEGREQKWMKRVEWTHMEILFHEKQHHD